MDWVSFWDGAHSIYVSDCHKQVHYARITADIARLLPGPRARVLDYGCGEALGAGQLSHACGALALADAAPTIRAKLKDRFAGQAKITVLSPDETAALPAGSMDVVIANSLLQYLSRADLVGLLAVWRRLLAPDGVLVIADVIPPGVSAIQDAAALLTFAAREGFLVAAVIGLARTAVSPYRRLRADLGLSTYEEADIVALIAAAGFAVERLPTNIGHNQRRMAFRAIPR